MHTCAIYLNVKTIVLEIHLCQFLGETQEEVWRTMRHLKSQGVSAILDYAAEDDVGEGRVVPSTTVTPIPLDNAPQDPTTMTEPSCSLAPHACPKECVNAVARVYDYKSEQQCDR
jgi:hypothetical protein